MQLYSINDLSHMFFFVNWFFYILFMFPPKRNLPLCSSGVKGED